MTVKKDLRRNYLGVAFKDKRGIWEWGQGKGRERIFHAAENQDEVSYQHQRLVHFFKEAGFFFFLV